MKCSDIIFTDLELSNGERIPYITRRPGLLQKQQKRGKVTTRNEKDKNTSTLPLMKSSDDSFINPYNVFKQYYDISAAASHPDLPFFRMPLTSKQINDNLSEGKSEDYVYSAKGLTVEYINGFWEFFRIKIMFKARKILY